MIFEQIFTDREHRTFSYILGDPASRTAAVIDPAFSHDLLVNQLDEHELKLEYIILTHGHYDHACNRQKFQERCGGKIVGHRALNPDIVVQHRDLLPLGELVLKFFETPGHTADSICILCQKKLMSGDLLFVGKIGGTATRPQAEAEYQSLKHVLMELDDDIEVCPGHDYGITPTSTIGRERRENPFLLQPDFAAFLNLKENWLEYKRKHGIQ